MGSESPNRCTKCLMPVTYPGVILDDHGVCNLCRDHRPFTPLGEDVLKEKLASRRGRKYDCIVGLSGGKDSSYLAWLATRRYGLRVLGVSYSFAFMSELAEENVRQLSKTLGFDLVRVTSPNRLEYNLVRNHIASVAATKTTWGQCLFCHYGIDAILHNAAVEHEVPFILSGVTKYELWNPGKRTSFLKRRLASLPLRDKLNFAWYQFKAYWYLVRQRLLYRVPGNSVLAAYSGCELPKPGPEVIRVYDYVRWDQNVIEETLVREAGWRRPDLSLTWRYDCSLERLLDFTYKEEFGISTTGVYLSHLIRDGGITREKALAILQEAESRASLNRGAEVVFDFIHLAPRLRQRFLRAD
jgi:hypothetical protein